MLSRRSFLALAIGLTPCGSALVWSAARRLEAAADPTEMLLTLVSDRSSAASIGRDILTQYPDLLEKISVSQALEALQRGTSDGSSLDATTMHTRYQAALRHDFASSRIVEVHGWQLAYTEVCLFAFLAGDPRSNG